MTDPRRNALILLIVAGLLVGSAVAIVAKKTLLGLELKGGVELVYQAKPTAQSKVTSESLERAINIMRKRVDQLGVAQPEIQSSGNDQIDVGLPNVQNAERAQNEVGKTAQLQFYDWEPNVIGPTGEPAPTEGSVTGDSSGDPGGSNSGLPEYQAIQRAMKRKAVLRTSDTTWSHGCTPAQVGDCLYGDWYLLDTAHERVVRGPEETEHNLFTDLPLQEKGTKLKAVRVNPGTVLVQAHAVEPTAGKVTVASPNSWYVLNDDPVLNGEDITNPAQGNDECDRAAERDVWLQLARQGRVRTRHQGDRAPRPGSAASGDHQRRGDAALRGRAGRPADHGALDRLLEVPRRDRRLHGLRDLRRLHDHLRAEPRQRAAVRRAAGAAGADLPLAGLRDARQTGAQPGSRRGPRGLRGGVPVPARVLPLPRRDRRRRPGHLRRLLLRARQADPRHPDAARDRRPDPHDRRVRGREHRHLRARQGGDPRRQIDRLGHRHRLQARLRGDRRRERRDVHDRVHPVRARHRGSQGVRVHAGHRHARVAVHRRARHAGRPRRDEPLAARHASGRARRGAPRAKAGRSTSWAPRSGSSPCRARSCWSARWRSAAKA